MLGNRNLVEQQDRRRDLPRTPPPASSSDDDAVHHERASPDAVDLATFECALQARCGETTAPAHGLSTCDVDVVVGEEQAAERSVPIGTSGIRKLPSSSTRNRYVR